MTKKQVVSICTVLTEYKTLLYSIFSLDNDCPEPENTTTVGFECWGHGSMKSCEASCLDDDFVFLEPVPKRFNCGPDGTFNNCDPPLPPVIPECGGTGNYLTIIHFQLGFFFI